MPVIPLNELPTMTDVSRKTILGEKNKFYRSIIDKEEDKEESDQER